MNPESCDPPISENEAEFPSAFGSLESFEPILGGAFAVPVVASFDMGALTGVASALQPNGTRSRNQHLAHRFPNGTAHHGDDSHVEF